MNTRFPNMRTVTTPGACPAFETWAKVGGGSGVDRVKRQPDNSGNAPPTSESRFGATCRKAAVKLPPPSLLRHKKCTWLKTVPLIGVTVKPPSQPESAPPSPLTVVGRSREAVLPLLKHSQLVGEDAEVRLVPVHQPDVVALTQTKQFIMSVVIRPFEGG